MNINKAYIPILLILFLVLPLIKIIPTSFGQGQPVFPTCVNEFNELNRAKGLQGYYYSRDSTLIIELSVRYDSLRSREFRELSERINNGLIQGCSREIDEGIIQKIVISNGFYTETFELD